MILYNWQKQLIKDYKGKGIVKGVPGSGKTLGAIYLIKNRKYQNILIAVPTKALKGQWEKELAVNDIPATVETFHKLCKPKYKSQIVYDILVVDECHRSTSPKFVMLYEYQKRKHILGLSATPNKDAEKLCGTIIVEVSLKEANIANFKVIFKSIELSFIERNKYRQLTHQITNIASRPDSDSVKNKKLLEAIIFKRRSVVYSAKTRIDSTCALIHAHADKNILVICQRIEQANMISEITGFPVYHSQDSNTQTLDDFKRGKIKCLISVAMLKEGFDKRDIDILIIASTFLTEAYHIQSIGRAFRLPNDAVIYILVARDTSDEKILKFKNMYIHEIDGVFAGKYETEMSPLLKEYYAGSKYSIDYHHVIFRKTKQGRQYQKYNPIQEELKKYLPIGGMFRVIEDKVLVKDRKDKSKILVVGMLSKPIEADKTK